MKNNISEVDLYLYYMSVEKGYYELMELYGILYEFNVCPHCKKKINVHMKVMKELLNTFEDTGQIRIPKDRELKQMSRDITIWKGLHRCKGGSGTLKAEEYADRYELTVIAVYKIKEKVTKIIGKFDAMRTLYRKRKKA